MKIGVDTSQNCKLTATALANAGVEFVCRYYANRGKKILTRDEALAISQANMSIVAVWEDGYPTKASYFSYAKGVDDGSSAYHDALTIGQPAGTPIYFAVDYDASPAEIGGMILDYFRGLSAGFLASSGDVSDHSIGVYGSGATCAFLLARNLVSYTWLSQSKGFRGYREFTNWNIRQGPSEVMNGLSIDKDEATEDFGGFQLG